MTRKLSFLPESRSDFDEASAYYEIRSPSRGSLRFRQAFQETLQRIKSGLITHQKVFDHFHRVFVPRFPYVVYYRLAGEEAVIVADLYARFHPEKTERLLKHRT